MFVNWKKILPLLLGAASLTLTGAEHSYTLSMPWKPQAQFAGYYYAAAHGIFKQHGLEVEISHRPPEHSVFSTLRQPESDFIVAPLTAALQTADSGGELVNIAQISQHSPVSLVGRRSAGITGLDSLTEKGRALRAGCWQVDFDLLPELFLARHAPEAQRFPLNDGVDLFLWKAVDLISVMEYNEYYLLLAAGIPESELIRFRMRDCGLNIPEDGVYTFAETFRRYPADCGAMRNAVLEGWRQAIRNPAEALRLVRKECRKQNVPFDPAHQLWMLKRFAEDMELGQPEQFGTISRHNYDTAVQLLKRSGRIRKAPEHGLFAPLQAREEN